MKRLMPLKIAHPTQQKKKSVSQIEGSYSLYTMKKILFVLLILIPKINIPEVENRFTVTAEGCDGLKVSVKDYAERYPRWVTLSSEASGGVAEVS